MVAKEIYELGFHFADGITDQHVLVLERKAVITKH
jgi:hypothetical protein